MIHLVDSDVFIDILSGKDWAVAYHEQLVREHAVISAMAYGEIWEGIIGSRNRIAAEAMFEKLVSPFDIIPLEVATMRLYGEIRIDLRRRGLQIGAPDVLIAATAIQHGYVLSTRNTRHFSRIPMLSIVDPSRL